jgi:hypothetical protein
MPFQASLNPHPSLFGGSRRRESRLTPAHQVIGCLMVEQNGHLTVVSVNPLSPVDTNICVNFYVPIFRFEISEKAA